ncbi:MULTISPECIES: hypothetical protein [unclassified Mycobacterium]|uniref:hypothetical protein n=1 Tax=unclassified Mycobacterium TaxID=2642494 RepID=UPI0007FEEC1D|nr:MULTISPECIES: hypothetical protein [unclassified Mycobacterium]OBH03594.1 hypothetical protein A5696_00410 [Mycobacterium sp. E2699]OBI54872.1 hypothetical protein A5705_24145 [Mycobacterium sp. E787]
MSTALFGFLTVLALALALVFAAIAGVYVRRLGDRATTPVSEQIGAAKTVLAKVRKGQPISREELDYAKQITAVRSSPMTFCIPAALFSVGCFYVFGSLYHLHGATPSERTFLGVFPMLASLNFTTQILRSARLKRRLRKMA